MCSSFQFQKRSVICGFEMTFKKSVCCSFRLINDNIISVCKHEASAWKWSFRIKISASSSQVKSSNVKIALILRLKPGFNFINSSIWAGYPANIITGLPRSMASIRVSSASFPLSFLESTFRRYASSTKSTPPSARSIHTFVWEAVCLRNEATRSGHWTSTNFDDLLIPRSFKMSRKI